MQLRTCLTLFVSLLFLLSQGVLQGQRECASAQQLNPQKPEKQEKAVYEIPFEYDSSVSHALVIKVRVNGGAPRRFLLDTGMGFPVLLRKSVTKNLQFTKSGNKSTLEWTEAQVEEIKDVQFQVLAQNKQTRQSIGLPPFLLYSVVSDEETMLSEIACDGVIGLNYFFGQVLTFDFARKTLTVTPGDREITFPPDVVLLPLRYENNVLITQIESHRGTKVDLIVDTGAPFLSLRPEKVTAFEVVKTPPVELSQGMVGKGWDAEVFLLAPLKVGAFQESNLVAYVPKQTNLPSIMGMQFLSRLRVTFMVGRRLMALERSENHAQVSQLPGGAEPVIFQDKSGFTLVDVPQGSSAYKAGLKPGDRIISVDGMTTKTMPVALVQGRVRGVAGTKASFQLEREGRSIKLTYIRNGLFDLSNKRKPGLGISVASSIEGAMRITDVDPLGFGFKAGLVAGDEIISVNGKQIATTPLSVIVQEIKNRSASILTLEVKKVGTKQLKTIVIKRR